MPIRQLRSLVSWSPTFGNGLFSHKTDPESLEWSLLDDGYRKKLDQKSYVSLSREKRLAQETSSTCAGLLTHGSQDRQTISMPLATSLASDEVSQTDHTFESEPLDNDWEMSPKSLFDYNMPGVLNAEEVTRLDLDHWKFVVRNTLIEFKVWSHLVFCIQHHTDLTSGAR